MTARVPVLLAGVSGAGAQDHQRRMWAPNLAAAGLDPVGVWIPQHATDDEIGRATRLSADLGVPLDQSASPTRPAQATVACLRGDDRITLLRHAAETGMPVLLDKPTLDSTQELERLVASVPDAHVLPGHHLAAHPAFVRLLAAVRGAEVGLLRAVFAELVVPSGDGLSPVGELRNLGVYLLDLVRALTGAGEIRLQAGGTPDGASWTLLGTGAHDVVVSAHVSRLPATATDASGDASPLRAAVRVQGTHGSAMADLTRPALTVRGSAGQRRVPYGENSVVALLGRLASAARGETATPPLSDLLALSRALDGVAHSAATREPVEIAW
ncbi:Gfo/Idh/MocA family oxidoreductase [Agromyces silvae]|uniref:hypothetical protein n=1 Tax=Agromyces silvae TaxID=3388266 RepID=UPI00280A7D8E|nr:hypothetical protein [Agromyces protaetiae]